jgi:tetratricopeptide (TPR) repeat protein
VPARAVESAEERIGRAEKLLASGDESQQNEGAAAMKAVIAELQPAAKDGKDAKALLLLGRAYISLGDGDRAVAALDKTIALDPASADAHRWKGIALENGTDPDAAIRELTKATELGPKQPENFYELGEALAQAKKNDEALAAFREAARIDPKHAKALLMAGVMLMQEEKEGEALDLFKKAAAADPSYVMAWQNVGQVCQNQGKPAEAVEAFRQVVKLRPGDLNARGKIVQCDEALGKLKERDADRAAIFELFTAGKVEQPFYCRDQFAVGKVKVMVFEYFELKGERAVRYSFNILDDGGQDVKYKISLGSYDFDTQLGREQGVIGKDQRMFHLDAYYPNGEHRTYGMYTKEPTYDETKKTVTGIIKGEIKPSAASIPGK